jgi:superfamily I DNA/RNA helicase
MVGYIFLGAFNKSMGDELKDRTKGMKNVKASTLHGAGFGALRFRYKNISVDANKVRDIAYDLIEGEDREDLEPFVAFVLKLVGLAKDTGIGFFNAIEDDSVWFDLVDKFDVADLLDEKLSVEKGIKFSQVLLRRSNKIKNVVDFSDMIYMVLVDGIHMLQNDWVLIDEAQDTNPTRRALAKKMLKPRTGRLIAVGDPHQAIFGFTGADNDALDQIRKEFGAITLPLTVTYRCPKKVVELARNWVSHITADDSAPDGEVINAKAEDVFGDKSTYTFTPDDVILCRNNAPLISTAFTLIRRGIACRIEGRDIGVQLANLAGKWKVKRLDTLRDRLEKYREREIQKAMAKGQEQKADSIADRVDCLYILIERAEEKRLDVDGLIEMIYGMFSDADKAPKDVLTLSSVHKFKGHERKRVFLLGRHEYMPSPYARQQWQQEQERNLIYVAVTRAMETLVEVN